MASEQRNYGRQVLVLFIWDVPQRLRDYLQDGLLDVPQVQLVFPSVSDDQGFLSYAPEADIIVGWRPTRELLLAARKLTLHINPGAGVQHLVDVFREVNRTRSVPVLLANGHGNSYFAAQHAVALLLALMNRILVHDHWMRRGEWRRGDSDASSIPLRYRKVGLLGYGAINKKVHSFLSGFDVEFSILRREWPQESEKLPTPADKYLPSELHAFLEEINILVVAVPQTSETVGLIGMQELELLGPDGLLINVGRGAVVDEESLYNALKNGVICGAGIDVWYDYEPDEDEKGRKYPYSRSCPFHELENVILSPHRAASPMNDLARWDEVIENIRRVATGRKDLLSIVNISRGY